MTSDNDSDPNANFADLDRMPTDVYDTQRQPQAPVSNAPPDTVRSDDSPPSPEPKWRRSNASKTIDIGPLTLSVPNLTWLDDAAPFERLKYAGGGLIAGMFFGAIFGVLNTFLQGWAMVHGTPQIFGLAFAFGLLCAPMAAMRPRRVDQLLEKIGIVDD